MISDPWMGSKKATSHTSDFMAEGIRFYEDLIRLEPVNHRGGVDFVKLDVANGF